MKSLGLITVFLTMVLILPLSVQAQPPEAPPLAGPIKELQEQLEAEISDRTDADDNLQNQIDNIQPFGLDNIYIKTCLDSYECGCDDSNDLTIAVAVRCSLVGAVVNHVDIDQHLTSGCTISDDGTQYQVYTEGSGDCYDPGNGNNSVPSKIDITCLRGVGPLTCKVGWLPFPGDGACFIDTPYDCNFR